jgi:hypothetical protein
VTPFWWRGLVTSSNDKAAGLPWRRAIFILKKIHIQYAGKTSPGQKDRGSSVASDGISISDEGDPFLQCQFLNGHTAAILGSIRKRDGCYSVLACLSFYCRYDVLSEIFCGGGIRVLALRCHELHICEKLMKLKLRRTS